MNMHCPKMMPTSTTCMVLIIAMLFFSPCNVVAFQFKMPKPYYLPVPSYRHGGQGHHALPPLPPYHVIPPPTHPSVPVAPTNSPVWSIPPPTHTSQSPPHPRNRNYPGFPRPYQSHPMIPIPRHKSSPPPPPVSGFAQPPTTPYVTTPTPTPPTEGYSYLTAPAQPPVSSVPHSQYPPSPPHHHQFPPSPPHHHHFLPSPPRHQFPPFPPRHQFPPFAPHHQVPPVGTFPAPGPVAN